VPSTFVEPFGMVSIEALASGTPVIGLNIGATKEIVTNNKTGFIINYQDDKQASQAIAKTINKLPAISRQDCFSEFERRFTARHMVKQHADLYRKLLEDN